MFGCNFCLLAIFACFFRGLLLFLLSGYFILIAFSLYFFITGHMGFHCLINSCFFLIRWIRWMQQTQRMQQKLSISAIKLMKYSQRLIRWVFFFNKNRNFLLWTMFKRFQICNHICLLLYTYQLFFFFWFSFIKCSRD